MKKKKLLALSLILIVVAFVLFFAFKNAKPKGGPSKLDTDKVRFTFKNEAGETESLGWKAYVDRFYTSVGTRASERVEVHLNKIQNNPVWLNKIIEMAPNWGLTPAKKLVDSAIQGAIDSGHIKPNAGNIPPLKSYPQARGVVFT